MEAEPGYLVRQPARQQVEVPKTKLLPLMQVTREKETVQKSRSVPEHLRQSLKLHPELMEMHPD